MNDCGFLHLTMGRSTSERWWPPGSSRSLREYKKAPNPRKEDNRERQQEQLEILKISVEDFQNALHQANHLRLRHDGDRFGERCHGPCF